MHFKVEHIETFISIYESSRHLIRGFDGCEHVELLRDENNPAIFFTFSRWLSTAHLEAYRQSDIFNGVWARTKVLFDDKPQAWTVKEVNFP